MHARSPPQLTKPRFCIWSLLLSISILRKGFRRFRVVWYGLWAGSLDRLKRLRLFCKDQGSRPGIARIFKGASVQRPGTQSSVHQNTNLCLRTPTYQDPKPAFPRRDLACLAKSFNKKLFACTVSLCGPQLDEAPVRLEQSAVRGAPHATTLQRLVACASVRALLRQLEVFGNEAAVLSAGNSEACCRSRGPEAWCLVCLLVGSQEAFGGAGQDRIGAEDRSKELATTSSPWVRSSSTPSSRAETSNKYEQ